MITAYIGPEPKPDPYGTGTRSLVEQNKHTLGHTWDPNSTNGASFGTGVKARNEADQMLASMKPNVQAVAEKATPVPFPMQLEANLRASGSGNNPLKQESARIAAIAAQTQWAEAQRLKHAYEEKANAQIEQMEKVRTEAEKIKQDAETAKQEALERVHEAERVQAEKTKQQWEEMEKWKKDQMDKLQEELDTLRMRELEKEKMMQTEAEGHLLNKIRDMQELAEQKVKEEVDKAIKETKKEHRRHLKQYQNTMGRMEFEWDMALMKVQQDKPPPGGALEPGQLPPPGPPETLDGPMGTGHMMSDQELPPGALPQHQAHVGQPPEPPKPPAEKTLVDSVLSWVSGQAGEEARSQGGEGSGQYSEGQGQVYPGGQASGGCDPHLEGYAGHPVGGQAMLDEWGNPVPGHQPPGHQLPGHQVQVDEWGNPRIQDPSQLGPPKRQVDEYGYPIAHAADQPPSYAFDYRQIPPPVVHKTKYWSSMVDYIVKLVAVSTLIFGVIFLQMDLSDVTQGMNNHQPELAEAVPALSSLLDDQLVEADNGIQESNEATSANHPLEWLPDPDPEAESESNVEHRRKTLSVVHWDNAAIAQQRTDRIDRVHDQLPYIFKVLSREAHSKISKGKRASMRGKVEI